MWLSFVAHSQNSILCHGYKPSIYNLTYTITILHSLHIYSHEFIAINTTIKIPHRKENMSHVFWKVLPTPLQRFGFLCCHLLFCYLFACCVKGEGQVARSLTCMPLLDYQTQLSLVQGSLRKPCRHLGIRSCLSTLSSVACNVWRLVGKSYISHYRHHFSLWQDSWVLCFWKHWGR